MFEATNNMRRLLPLALAAAALMAAACGSVRPSKYYSMELPSAAASTAAPLKVSLLVGRILAPQLYRDDRIIYRTSATEVGAYEYHRWAEPPAAMIEAMLVRRLRAGGRFASVQSLASNARGDYILRGRLHHIEESTSGAGVTARLALEVELFERGSGAAVWTKFFSAEEPVSGKEVPAVVEALNRGLHRGLDQISAELEDYIAKHPLK
jgi:hypothetical protein